MLHLTTAQLEIVRHILHTHVPHARVVAFGSRAHGTPKPFSDLDLAVYSAEPLQLSTISKLRDAFSDSNLTFRVDLVDMSTVSDEFQDVIKSRNEVIQE